MTDSTQMAQTENNGRHQATQDRPVSRVLQALKRFFWMDEQMAAAVRDGYGPGQLGWEEFRLARAAANEVKTLGETGEGLGSALLLIRAALMLLTRSHLARLGIEVKPTATGDECWTQFIEQPTAADIASELTVTQRGLLASVLDVQGEAFLAKQSEEQRKIALSTMADIANKLATPFEIDAKSDSKCAFPSLGQDIGPSHSRVCWPRRPVATVHRSPPPQSCLTPARHRVLNAPRLGQRSKSACGRQSSRARNAHFGRRQPIRNHRSGRHTSYFAGCGVQSQRLLPRTSGAT